MCDTSCPIGTLPFSFLLVMNLLRRIFSVCHSFRSMCQSGQIKGFERCLKVEDQGTWRRQNLHAAIFFCQITTFIYIDVQYITLLANYYRNTSHTEIQKRGITTNSCLNYPLFSCMHGFLLKRLYIELVLTFVFEV